MIKINEKLVKYNFSSRKGEKIKYITIHDTGNPDRGADAEAHFKLHDRADREHQHIILLMINRY